MNVFEERGDSLARLDYAPILDAVLKAVKREAELFEVSPRNRVMAHASKVAKEVAENRRLRSPLVSGSRRSRAATVNFDDDSRFHEGIRRINAALEESFENACREDIGKSPDEVVEGLCFPLEDLKVGNASEPGFAYDFPVSRGIGRRRLRLQKRGEPGGNSRLSLHRLSIEVDISNFDENLAKSLENHVEHSFSDDESYDDIGDLLDHALGSPEGRAESGVERLREFLSEEALGVVKREASTLYLDFLLGGIRPDTPGAPELRRLRDRMLALRSFVDDPSRSDSDYEVPYGAGTCDLRQSFSRADAFDSLPIVPRVEGSLGESRDHGQGRLRYAFGLKFKLNGKVASTSHASALEYHTDLIDPDTQLHRSTLDKRFGGNTIAARSVLYAFVFDPEVDDPRSPSSPLAEAVISALKSPNPEEKKEALRKLASTLRSSSVEKSLDSLEKLLRKSLARDAVFEAKDRLAHIGVGDLILEESAEKALENGSFFTEDLLRNPKSLLKRVSVAEADKEGWLLSMPVRLEVSNPRFSDAGVEPESYTMAHETEGMHTLPVFMGLLSRSESGRSTAAERVFEAYRKHIAESGHPYLLFPYGAEAGRILKDERSGGAFVYSLVFGILALLTIEMMLSHARRDVYVPILRFQARGKDKPLAEEGYFRSLSKTIAHLLSECPLAETGHKRVSRSQGLVVSPPPERYKIQNAASSMYAGVPMRFTEDSRGAGEESGVDKFAVLAVSSWMCDSVHPDGFSEAASSEGKLSCVYGEAVTLDLLSGGDVRVEQFGTFADVYDETRLHHRPGALRDVAEALYERGYRHIALIAKSPFQDRISFTASVERLFFLSKETLGFLRSEREDFYVYPVFFDRYFVVKPDRARLKANSLYIQDVGELGEVAGADRNTIPFLHVFNGISVGRETFYNGTLAYSAVTGPYEGVLDERATWRNLIDDDDGNGSPNLVKNDIVRYLTLFHFSRFEKSGGGLGFSLNPFSGLFGDECVGRGSVFLHASEKRLGFNSLAFLCEAKKALLPGVAVSA